MKNFKPLLSTVSFWALIALLTIGLVVLLRLSSDSRPAAPRSPVATVKATVEATPSPPVAETAKVVTITPLPGLAIAKENEILTSGHFGWLRWSPDSSSLLYTKFSNEFLEVPNGVWEKGEIWLFDVATGNSKRLLPSGQVAAWSPDGRRFSVSIINPQTKMYDIEVYDLSTQAVTPVGSSTYYFTTWISKEELLFIAGQSLKVVNSLSGKMVGKIELGEKAVNAPERIANLNSRIITYDQQGKLIEVNALTGQTEATIAEAAFDWMSVSPSGRDLAYVTQDIPPAFGILNLESGKSKVLLRPGERDFINPRMFNPVWSPDGRFVAIAVAKTTGTNVPKDVYLFDVASGHMYETPLIENIDQNSLGWSPDGKRLAFSRTSTSEAVIQTLVFVAELE